MCINTLYWCFSFGLISLCIIGRAGYLFIYFCFLLIYFNWRLMTLQYCSGFCHTLTWIRHGGTCVPHPEAPPTFLPSHPSGSSQCTGLERPVSCIEPGLAICFTYGNAHVSLLFSQIIPLFPSPTESKSLSLYPCLFCCLTYRVVATIFLNSTYVH